MLTQRLLWLFVLMLAGLTTSAATLPIEDSELHIFHLGSNNFQEENRNSFGLLNFEINSITQNYLRKKQDTSNFFYHLKDNQQIIDCELFFVLYPKNVHAIGLRLPSHSISYPFHTFL
tara:strand:- start:7889 stop:8242 length:354 start_codon:yes stop_codon:yes gene_type:complete